MSEKSSFDKEAGKKRLKSILFVIFHFENILGNLLPRIALELIAFKK